MDRERPNTVQDKDLPAIGLASVVVSEELKPYAKRKTELSLQDVCIFWGSRVVVPPPGRSQIVEELHETHPGPCSDIRTSRT